MWESWQSAGVELHGGAAEPKVVVDEDVLTLIVWILRLVLPCLLCWATFGSKLRLPWWSDRRRYSRSLLLEHFARVSAEGGPAPEEVANLVLVTEETAPALFQKPPPPKPRGDRERRDERGDRRDRRERPRADAEARAAEEAAAAAAAAAAAEAAEQAASEEQMHLESLVNFVAFNKREQIRVFLPDEKFVPKPPPKPPKAPMLQSADAASERANLEAQMVLRGVLNAPKSGAAVARGLHAQLMDLQIVVSRSTFELMVQACMQAKSLQAASDLLMSMEAAGHTPSNELLDQVMELYLLRKSEDKRKSYTDAGASQARTDFGNEAVATAVPAADGAPPAVPGATAPAPAAPSAFAASPAPAAAAEGPSLGYGIASIAPVAANPPPPPPGPPPLDMIQPGPAAAAAVALAQPMPELQHAPMAPVGPGPAAAAAAAVALAQSLPELQHAQMAPGPWDAGVSQIHMPMDGVRWHPHPLDLPHEEALPAKPRHEDLPAFSVPDEFAAPKESRDEDNEEPAADGAPKAEDRVASRGFNPDAQVFVPGAAAQDFKLGGSSDAASAAPIGMGDVLAGYDAAPAAAHAARWPSMGGALHADAYEANGFPAGMSASASLATAMGRGSDAAAFGYAVKGYDYGAEASSYISGSGAMDMHMSDPMWGVAGDSGVDFFGQNRRSPGDGFAHAYGHGQGLLGDGYAQSYGHGQNDYGDGQWCQTEPPSMSELARPLPGSSSFPSKGFKGPGAGVPQELLGDLQSRVQILKRQLQAVEAHAAAESAPDHLPRAKGKGSSQQWHTWRPEEAGSKLREGKPGKLLGKLSGKGGAPGVAGQPAHPDLAWRPGDAFSVRDRVADIERRVGGNAEDARLEDQRQQYGEILFAKVYAIEPRVELTQRITGMLLELPQHELLLNLTSPDELRRRVEEAILVLKQDGIID